MGNLGKKIRAVSAQLQRAATVEECDKILDKLIQIANELDAEPEPERNAVLEEAEHCQPAAPSKCSCGWPTTPCTRTQTDCAVHAYTGREQPAAPLDEALVVLGEMYEVADAEGMDDETVIPVWPADVAKDFAPLKVKHIRAIMRAFNASAATGKL